MAYALSIGTKINDLEQPKCHSCRNKFYGDHQKNFCGSRGGASNTINVEMWDEIFKFERLKVS